MRKGDTAASQPATSMTNGKGAAAVLAAGIGSFLVAVFAIAADKSSTIKSMLSFYKPTGPLSGVTTSAILIWLVLWFALDLRWRERDVAMARTNSIALAFLVLSLLLTFPSVADLF